MRAVLLGGNPLKRVQQRASSRCIAAELERDQHGNGDHAFLRLIEGDFERGHTVNPAVRSARYQDPSAVADDFIAIRNPPVDVRM